MSETFDCPRRAEVGGAPQFPGPDRWREDQTCSYCGSLSPAKLFEAIEAGTALDPTDKSYKLYIGKLGADGQEIHASPAGKFYFQHLSEAERRRFVELSNAGKLHMPHGWFYVMPFFMRQAADGVRP